MKNLTKLPSRILTGFKVGFWAMRNQEVLAENTFKMLSELLNLILKVSCEDRHYMTQIVITNHMDDSVQPIVYIWAGAGAGAAPLKRIQELVEENNLLKDKIKNGG